MYAVTLAAFSELSPCRRRAARKKNNPIRNRMLRNNNFFRPQHRLRLCVRHCYFHVFLSLHHCVCVCAVCVIAVGNENAKPSMSLDCSTASLSFSRLPHATRELKVASRHIICVKLYTKIPSAQLYSNNNRKRHMLVHFCLFLLLI